MGIYIYMYKVISPVKLILKELGNDKFVSYLCRGVCVIAINKHGKLFAIIKVGLSNLELRFGEQMHLSPLVASGLEVCMTLGCNSQPLFGSTSTVGSFLKLCRCFVRV